MAITKINVDKQSNVADSSFAFGVTNAIDAVQADVNQNEADADAAIAAEAEARETADTTEAAARATADTALDTAYKAADTALQGNIDVETGRIDAILSGSNVDLNQIVEVVAAYELADTSIISSITSLQADVDGNEADADAAIAAQVAKEAAYEVSNDAALSTETGRIDAILEASDADKDSFAEIVTLINSVDTENDEAFAA